MRTYTTACIALIALFILSGCVGIAYVGPKTGESSRAHISGDRVPFTSHPKREDYLKAYGQPSKSYSPNKATFTTNKNEWCGLLIFAVIPIPIMAPTCSEKVEVTFENETALGQKDIEIKDAGLICSPLLPLVGWHGGTKSLFCDW